MTVELDDVLDDVPMIRSVCQESLYEFVKEFWGEIEAVPYVDNWHIQAIAEHLEAVTSGQIPKLLINIPPGSSKSLLVSVFWPMWEWARNPAVRWFFASYDQQLSTRDSVRCRNLMSSLLYQVMWGDKYFITGDQNLKTYYVNSAGGYRMATTIKGHGTGEHPDRIICDDPHDVAGAESELERQSVLDWMDLTMTTRGVSRKARRVIIMQRLHPKDLSAHVLGKGDWTHLCLPMRFERNRMVTTPLGWNDPRTVEGELLTPNQFDEEAVSNMEKGLGVYGCNPAEAPILMADLSMKPISEIREGDKVIGFGKKIRTDGVRGRMRLHQALVLGVSVRKAPVVKMTLSSGEVIRCTRDHKWFIKDRGSDRSMYLPVCLGRTSLSRICPPSLPLLSYEEEHLAGWLSGFWDGEGSASRGIRRGSAGYKEGTSISFYQGSGRNLPLCEKLERALTHFGFPFSYREDMRKENKTAACYGYRCYRLAMQGLPSIQRFLHIIRPTKWRRRLEKSVLGSKFVRGREKVVSIEPDGVETVYALETTTGNYVVWGLASSNSAGQLQQRPSPREGGLFKAPWFRNRVRAAPYVAKRIRFWDRAATLDGGCATAGVLMCKAGDRYYVEHVVYGQWAPYERNQTIVATANRDRNRYGPENDPIIYIESERGSTGLESFQYLAAQLAGFRIKEDNPKGSKDVRAEPLADQFAAGNMYLVEDGTWDVEAYVEEFLLFKPDVTVKRLGGMKDRVDGSSGAFNLLSGLKPVASLRVVDLNVGGKKSVRRVVVGTEEDLQYLRIDRQSLLITVADPLVGESLSHSLELLVGSLELRFADLIPEDYQDRWEIPIDSYNRKPSELVMSRDDGRKLWSTVLKRRDPAWDALVLRGPLRVTLAVAVAVCESLNLPVAQTIYLPRDPDYKCDGAKDVENKHVYSLVKSSRFLVVD